MGNHALTQDCSQCPHRLGELLLDAQWARLSTRNRTSLGVSRGLDPPPPPTTLVTLGVRLTGTGVQCPWVRVSGSRRLWTVKTNPHVLVMETPMRAHPLLLVSIYFSTWLMRFFILYLLHCCDLLAII